ncbi:MAG: hypothetical protein WBV94_12065 [Blastocatellia bacterium]
MNDNTKEKNSSLLRWAAGISILALVVMETVEPLLFEDEKYDTWRIVKIAALFCYTIITVIALRKPRS